MHNNTGSGCIEAHTLASTLDQYIGHTATNRPSISPDDAELITADINGDNQDELISVEYRNTGSSMIEIHIWNSTYQQWAAHIATSRPAIDPVDADIISADRDGNGQDELYLIEYQNTASGLIEIHGWTASFQQWFLHSASNHGQVDPADNGVIAADSNGDGKDELFLIKYQNNQSGTIEFHGWTENFQSWFLHSTSNHSALNPADNEVIGANLDQSSRDEFLLIKYRQTESGRIEIHGWTENFQSWFLHTALPG